jgi:hypothetical protein
MHKGGKDSICGKKQTKAQEPAQNSVPMWRIILFLPPLSSKFFEQLSAGAILLNLVVQFVDVVAHCQQENLC